MAPTTSSPPPSSSRSQSLSPSLSWGARVDRLLRRWLPGYNFLRNITISINHSDSDSVNQTHSHQVNTIVNQRARVVARKVPEDQQCGPQFPLRKREDGEILLETGKSKSEFCAELEQVLQAKLSLQQ